MREAWFERGLDGSRWDATTVPGDSAPDFEGCVWRRRSFEVPVSWVRGLTKRLRV